MENYIVRHLIEFDQVDYDSQADFLYKLAGQMVERIRSYLTEPEDVENVCLVHGKEELLSKVVYGLIMRRRDPGVLHLRI